MILIHGKHQFTNDPSWSGPHIHPQIGVFASVNPSGMILSSAVEATVAV